MLNKIMQMEKKLLTSLHLFPVTYRLEIMYLVDI